MLETLWNGVVDAVSSHLLEVIGGPTAVILLVLARRIRRVTIDFDRPNDDPEDDVRRHHRGPATAARTQAKFRHMWHRFEETSDDHVECMASDCGVIVAKAALLSFTLPCPVPRCDSLAKRGEPCVMAPHWGGPTCMYCDRPGWKDDHWAA